MKLLHKYGVGSIVAVDSRGIIGDARDDLNDEKKALLPYLDTSHSGSLEDAIADADIFIGVSKPGLLTDEMVRKMGTDPIIFALETNIINLPLANYKKLINFFDEEEAQPVKVYFETASEYLNASHFRIDLFMDGDELVADVEGAADRLADAMSEKIKQVKEGEAAAKEAAKEAKAKTKKEA